MATPKPKTAATLFREAASLIEQALIKLDMSHYHCDKCRTKHYNNYTEAKTYERFTDTPQKLRETANRLDNQDKD